MAVVSKGYTEIAAPEIVVGGIRKVVYNKAYMKGDLRIWLSREIYPEGLRWHMSISTAKRYPVWDEIRDAWYALKPADARDVTMAMLLPPEREYVNVHPNCFHLHEIVE